MYHNVSIYLLMDTHSRLKEISQFKMGLSPSYVTQIILVSKLHEAAMLVLDFYAIEMSIVAYIGL